MPTTNPRLTITLPKRSHEVLSRFSAASGESMSQVISGFVDLALPSLERLVVLMERARDAPAEVRAGLLAAFERADRDVMPSIVAATRQGEMFLADAAFHASQGAPGRAPAQRARGRVGSAPRVLPDPRPVTRGSGGPRKGRKG